MGTKSNVPYIIITLLYNVWDITFSPHCKLNKEIRDADTDTESDKFKVDIFRIAIEFMGIFKNSKLVFPTKKFL